LYTFGVSAQLAPRDFLTERLRLRPYTFADEAAVFEVFADPDARAFYPEMSDPAQ
jgi:RimJ/RimL family protein N-acetyltransferase